MKIKKQIDVADYSSKEQELRKLQFSNFKVEDNSQAETKLISFTESKIIAEDVEYQVQQIDEEGNPVLDADGNEVFDTVLRDDIQTLRQVKHTVNYVQYNAVADVVKTNLPTGLTQTQIENAIVQEGIKIYIVQEGFYRGQLTLEDFE